MSLTEHQATELIKRLGIEAKAALRRYGIGVILLGIFNQPRFLFGVMLAR